MVIGFVAVNPPKDTTVPAGVAERMLGAFLTLRMIPAENAIVCGVSLNTLSNSRVPPPLRSRILIPEDLMSLTDIV